jgi:hypothetical protein
LTLFPGLPSTRSMLGTESPALTMTAAEEWNWQALNLATDLGGCVMEVRRRSRVACMLGNTRGRKTSGGGGNLEAAASHAYEGQLEEGRRS